MYLISECLNPIMSNILYLNKVHTVVPLLRDHKKSPQKWSLKRGMPHLMNDQELKPLVSVPDYPPNKASLF